MPNLLWLQGGPSSGTTLSSLLELLKLLEVSVPSRTSGLRSAIVEALNEASNKADPRS
jgi:hypothetical protein